MSYLITQKDQGQLLQLALGPTMSTGWKSDAKAFALRLAQDSPIAMIAVFQSFTAMGESEMHLGKPSGGAMTRGEIEAVIMLAFHARGLNLSRLWIHIAESNRPAQRASLAVGFDFEHRVRSGFLGQEDAIVMSMSRPKAGRPLPGHLPEHNRQVTEG